MKVHLVVQLLEKILEMQGVRIDSRKMPFLTVVSGHTQCWKGDANFRSHFSLFDLHFSLKDKRIFNSLYEKDVFISNRENGDPYNIAYNRVRLRETAFYYYPSGVRPQAGV